MSFKRTSSQFTLPSTQSGAVLIVVLLFLIMITVVGVIAVRNSSTNLKLATSDQINTVLLQASDSANNKIEQSVNGDPNSAQYKKIMCLTGIFGYYVLGDNEKDIISFCYRPREDFYNISNATIRRGTGVLVKNAKGYCNPKLLADYTSQRGTTMTQVMIKNTNTFGSGTNATSGNNDFRHMNIGTDTADKTVKKQQFNIYSTAVLPAYGNADSTKVSECFEKDASAATNNIAECMTDNNIPSKLLVEQVNLENIQSSEYCKKYGDTAVTGTKDALCPTASP